MLREVGTYGKKTASLCLSNWTNRDVDHCSRLRVGGDLPDPHSESCDGSLGRLSAGIGNPRGYIDSCRRPPPARDRSRRTGAITPDGSDHAGRDKHDGATGWSEAAGPITTGPITPDGSDHAGPDKHDGATGLSAARGLCQHLARSPGRPPLM